MSQNRADLYTRITTRIVADLEQGVRPWFKPWNAEHAAGRITRPLVGRKRWGDEGYAAEELVALSGQSAPVLH